MFYILSCLFFNAPCVSPKGRSKRSQKKNLVKSRHITPPVGADRYLGNLEFGYGPCCIYGYFCPSRFWRTN